MRFFAKFVNSSRPVLIVDDCSVYRTAVKGMLQKLGFNPTNILVAKDAISAKAHAHKHDFKLIICDYNLESNANGCQLLADLKAENSISRDCVLLVVTGDSSQHVVSGFAELEPDGYIIKPLNYLTLENRLPKWVYKKFIMSQVLRDFEQEKYQQVIDHNILDNPNTSIQTSLQLFVAKAQYELAMYNEAKASLRPLLTGNLKPKALKLLAKIYIAQDNGEKVLRVFEEINKEQRLNVDSLLLNAQYLFLKSDKLAAKKVIEEGLEKSPNNFNLYLTNALFMMASFNPDAALTSLIKAKNLAKHSVNDQVDLSLLHIAILLCNAHLAQNHKELTLHLDGVTSQVREMKRRFSSYSVTPLEHLVNARVFALTNDIEKAKEQLEEYREITTPDENYSHSLIEAIELDILEHSLEIKTTPSTSQKVIEGISHEALEQQALYLYKEYWLANFRQKQSQFNQLLQRSVQLQLNKEFEPSLRYLINASQLSPRNTHVACKTLELLTKVWPVGWSRGDVEQLIDTCISVLKSKNVQYSNETQGFIRLLKQPNLSMPNSLEKAS